MRLEFPISQRVSADKEGYDFLSALYRDITNADCSEIVVDFKLCKGFEANLSAVLGAIFNKQKDNGRAVFLRKPESPGVRRALSRNKFFKAFDLNTNNEDRENYIEYRRFSADDTQSFKEYIDSELVQKKRFPNCTERAKEKIKESICEIFANAIDHSGCRDFYCCGEVHPREGKNMLDMTFVNLGTSIVENVNNYLKSKQASVMTSCETLEWAFVEGNTTKQIPGGLGLAILKQFIKMNEGTIQMISGDAMIEIYGDTATDTKLDLWFPGTIVTVEFNGDDNKTYLMTDELSDKNNLF